MNRFIFQKERLSGGSRKQRISITTPSTWGFVSVVVFVATILLFQTILYCVIARISVYFVVMFLEYIAIRILFRNDMKQTLHQNLGDIDFGALGDFNMIN